MGTRRPDDPRQLADALRRERPQLSTEAVDRIASGLRRRLVRRRAPRLALSMTLTTVAEGSPR